MINGSGGSEFKQVNHRKALFQFSKNRFEFHCNSSESVRVWQGGTDEIFDLPHPTTSNLSTDKQNGRVTRSKLFDQ
ncbi:hypothetical protein ACH3XW_8645 [Acanthocheilonema viteae]